MGFRCRIFQAIGLTCHPFLEHSLLISARVRAFVPFSTVSVPNSLANFHRRFGDGDLWAHASDVPSGFVATNRINPPIFDSVLPEYRSKLTTEPDSVEL